MRALAALAVAGCLAATAALAQDMPDPKLTPGATNPDVGQANIHSTICVRGWTATVRPPLTYTAALKRQMLADPDYGYTDRDPTHYELDHLISLGLGGHASDPRNLWLQRWEGQWGAHAKDLAEVALNRAVCSGRLRLVEAQRLIATDWREAYRQFVGVPP